MKKISLVLLFLSLISYLLSPALSRAAVTPTVQPTTPTPTSSLDQQINNLKDRIASRVAQLNLVEKKGFVGNVTDVEETQITITDRQGNTRFIDVDELTKFSSPSAKANFGISDITKGTTIGILGLYNKESRRTLARFVDVVTFPQIISGAVEAIDGGNFSISIVTPSEKEIPINIATTTKTYMYTKGNPLARSGFSKIKQGERIMVVGVPDVQNKNGILALRLLLFPDLPVNQKIVLFKPGEFNVTPSTGSGNKIVPIIKNAAI